MTITITPSIDEPIISVTIEGLVDEAQIENMHEEVLQICEQLGTCFIILDVRGAESTIHENMALLVSGRLADMQQRNQMHVTVVGTLFPNEPQNNMTYRIFPEPDEALLYIQKHIAGLDAEESDPS